MLAFLAVLLVLLPLGVRLWTAWNMADMRDRLQREASAVERLKAELNQVAETAKNADQERYLNARERSQLYQKLAAARAELKALKEAPKDKRAA